MFLGDFKIMACAMHVQTHMPSLPMRPTAFLNVCIYIVANGPGSLLGYRAMLYCLKYRYHLSMRRYVPCVIILIGGYSCAD